MPQPSTKSPARSKTTAAMAKGAAIGAAQINKKTISRILSGEDFVV